MAAKSLHLLLFLFISYNRICLSQGTETIASPDLHRYGMHHSYDVKEYKLDIDLYNSFKTPGSSGFRALEIITLEIDSTLKFFDLNAVSRTIKVESVGLDGYSFQHSNDLLRIFLKKERKPGDVVKVRIIYQHKDVEDSAFYAYNGCVFTDNPAEGARKWFPCWDRPSDKALTDFTFHVPRSVRLGSNGYLADSIVVGDTLFYHWRSKYPMSTYLMTFVAKTDFTINKSWWRFHSLIGDSVPVRFYHQPGESMAQAEKLIAPLTDFYSDKFGVYPFEKIGFATLNNLFPWGGMENQTMVSLM
ncbi:MAG: hypothetical protein WCL00_12485, partial [Bacteroidota bacterium]